MKKTLITLVLVITALFTFTIGVNAEELDESTGTREGRPSIERVQMNPEERFEQHIENITTKHEEKKAEATATYEENMAAMLERIEIRKEIVATYAPELVDAYDDAYDDHVDVHELLFEEHMENRDEVFGVIIGGLETLADELFPLAESGEMTYQEVSEALKAYKQEQKATIEALREEYKADIEELNAQNEANKEIVEGLKAELRAAVEAGDTESANSIINELLEYLEAHVEYDYSKLAILVAVEF